MAKDWIELRQHADTGIETIRAHFEGHAYDPHWHDSYLVGMTLAGTQQFHCRRERHQSTPGAAFLLEPGETHDGDAPLAGGFTYLTFYLDERWLRETLGGLYAAVPDSYELHFARTIAREPALVQAIASTFTALHHDEMRIVQQGVMDNLLSQLTHQCQWRKRLPGEIRDAQMAQRARDYLYAHLGENIGLAELAQALGTDRFTLSRTFKHAFGMAPHAWLVQLRLARARAMLARGMTPVDVAAALGFADQSHLGRWFQRAYRLSPAHYRKLCTNIVLMCGVGPGEALRHAPWLARLMALAGALWLTWMSWQLFRSPAVSLSGEASKPFGAGAAAALQLINPKTWMMAMAVVTVFAPHSGRALTTLSFQALGFLVISLLCLAAWAWLGSGVQRVFRSDKALVRFQRLMALWLFACAWMGFFN